MVLYSHGTLQQRFTNDSLAEKLAKQGYIVLAPEHTGNDALAPFGAYCESEMTEPGVMSAALTNDPPFDAARNEYKGQTFDPFFLVGDAAPATGPSINPIEVSLTLDRVADYQAMLAALDGALGEVGAAADGSRVSIIGYSRGAMHGVVGAELIDAVQASVAWSVALRCALDGAAQAEAARRGRASGGIDSCCRGLRNWRVARRITYRCQVPWTGRLRCLADMHLCGCILWTVAKTKRVRVLMEPLEFAALERPARSRGASVADLIREAARAQYLEVLPVPDLKRLEPVQALAVGR